MANYGHVCFAMSKNEWIAKAIAWFTKSKWSHCFITVSPMSGKEMLMEAAGSGVDMLSFDIGYRDNPDQGYEVYRFKVDQVVIDAAILDCIKDLETPYGYYHYVWYIYRFINKFFGRDIKGQDNWFTKNEVCCNLTRHYLEAAGYKELFEGYGKNSESQEDVYQIIKSHPELFELIEIKA